MATPPQIGEVVKGWRKSRGLTLERLAGLSGVSKSMLSQIERGEANPTFAVLWGLTRALEIEFADLIGKKSTSSKDVAIEVVSAANTPEISGGEGRCRLRILSPPKLAGEIEWYDIEIDPGGILDSTPHPQGTSEHFTALTDGLTVTSGSDTRRLKAGESARYRADVPHRIANVARRKARGLMVVLYR